MRQKRIKYGKKKKESFMAGTHYKKKKHRKKKKNGFLRFLRFLAEIILLLLLAVFLFLSYKYTRMTKEKIRKKEIQVCEHISPANLFHMEGYRSIPVFLVDNSNDLLEDFLIIASIEKENGNVRFAAVDTNVWLTNAEGYTMDCAEVYEVNGPQGLLSMLNQNLELNMTDYLVLRTCIVEETVNRFGGIDLTLDAKEVDAMNNILRISNLELVPDAGKQRLSGEQVMAYWRNSASSLTEMERLATVAEKLLIYGEKENLGVANHVTDEVLYHVSTSLNLFEFSQMIKELIVYEIKPYAVMPQEVPLIKEELHKYLYP